MLRSVMIFTSGGLENGGGIGRMVGYMITAWQARGDPPELVVVDTRGPARRFTAPAYFIAALGRLLGAGLSHRPLTHVHIAGRGSTLRKAIVVALAKGLGLKIVLHLHDYDYRQYLSTLPSALVAPIRATFRAADAVVVLGQADRRTVTEVLGVDPRRVMVVPNAAPPPRLAPRAKDPSAPMRILFLGDPSRRKGVHDLLAALAHPMLAAQADAPAWTAIIAGGGGELEGFRAEAAGLGLSDRIAFPGWLGEQRVAELLAEADVLVLPSYGEGMAMSVLEAMSYGLCVVCTPVGALCEVIEPGVSGLLVEPGDVSALATALRQILDDPDLRRRLGAGARVRYIEGYAAASYPERIKAAFDLALAGPPGVTPASARSL